MAESISHNNSVRASALALYWIVQSEIGISLYLMREKELYSELVDDINERWFTRALIDGVLIRQSETNADALAFVTYLMERCNEGGDPLNELIELLGNWRERSTAPVHSRQVLGKWLGYDSQVPEYIGNK